MSAGRAGRQRGVAAVELALLLPMLFAMLALMLLFVRAFLAYNIMQDAAQHAARFMASIPLADMGNETQRNLAMTATRQIMRDAAASAGLPAFTTPGRIAVECDAHSCDVNTDRPLTVRVFVSPLSMPLSTLAGFRSNFGTGADVRVRIEATVPYGN